VITLIAMAVVTTSVNNKKYGSSHKSDKKKTVDNNNAIKIEMIIEPAMTATDGITTTKNDKDVSNDNRSAVATLTTMTSVTRIRI
jgi:hypothetical protein